MGFSSKNTGLGCLFLPQGIFPTQGLNLCLLHCRQTPYPLSHPGSPAQNGLIKRSTNNKPREGVGEGGPPTLLVGMQAGAATTGDGSEGPQKTKNRTAIRASNRTLGNIPQQNYNSERYTRHYVHSSTTHNSQDVETA